MQLIDISSLAPFGNMTFGDGLAGIKDPGLANVGYAESTTGYMGVTLSIPTKIVAADIISADNGFDASGNNTQITLQLYGKAGSLPINSTDGILLGSTAFTDINANTTKTITSNDQNTTFNHVWVRVITGVWAILAAFKPYTIDPVVEYFPPLPIDSGDKYTKTRTIDTALPLPQAETEFSLYRIGGYSPAAAVATLQYQGAFVHNMVNGYTGVIGGVSVVPHYRVGNTWEEAKTATKQLLNKGIVGGNIRDHTDHYINISSAVKMPIVAGKYYMFGIDLLAQTPVPQTGDGQASILVEGGNGLNEFRVTIDKNELLINNE